MLKDYIGNKISYFGGHETTVKLKDINQGSIFINSRIKKLKPDAVKYLKRFVKTENLDDIKKYIQLQYGWRSLLIRTIPADLHTKKTINTESKMLKNKASNFLKVLRSLKKNGYDPEKFKMGHIKINRKKVLCDGNHRFQLLYALHGDDYEVKVWKVGIITRMFITSVFLIAWVWVILMFILMIATHIVWFIVKIPIRIIGWIWRKTFGRIF